jgi:hypothetical protein
MSLESIGRKFDSGLDRPEKQGCRVIKADVVGIESDQRVTEPLPMVPRRPGSTSC